MQSLKATKMPLVKFLIGSPSSSRCFQLELLLNRALVVLAQRPAYVQHSSTLRLRTNLFCSRKIHYKELRRESSSSRWKRLKSLMQQAQVALKVPIKGQLGNRWQVSHQEARKAPTRKRIYQRRTVTRSSSQSQPQPWTEKIRESDKIRVVSATRSWWNHVN